MKKSLTHLATTTASTLIITLGTNCGPGNNHEAKKTENTSESLNAKAASDSNQEKIKFKVNEVRGSKESHRCGGRCVVQES